MIPKVKKVNRGQPFTPRAREWNAIADAVNASTINRKAVGAGPLTDKTGPGIIRIQNDSGTDRTRFDVMGLDAALFDPGTQFEQFSERIAISAVEPAAEHVGGRFVVLLEPIKDGEIGRARLVGECVVKVDVSDEDHEFAEIEATTYGNLVSAESGSALILWKPSGTGSLWAYVSLAVLVVQ